MSRPFPAIVALSVAANVALVARWRGMSDASALPEAVLRTTPAPSAEAAKPVEPEPETWAHLATGDLSDVVARLRADGVPPRMVRLIVGTLVAQRFADRHQAIVDAMTAKPWWQGQPYDAYSDPKITALRRQLAHDERDLLYQLLGADAPASDYDRPWAQRKYGSLTPEQTEKFRRINSDYDDLMAEVRDQAKNIILPEDREKLAYLEKEKRADIAKLLTADELFEFDLRSSATAKSVRNQLAAFDPTEEEFRAIFKIQQTIDAQFGDGRVANLTQEQRRQRRDLSNATTDQIHALLSPERFADYQLKTDPAYAQTSQLVASLDLPSTATAQVVSVQKDVTARMQAVIADKTLSGKQRTAEFASLAQEATTTLTTTLGEKGLVTYKQGAGGWLNTLVQRAQPPSAPRVPPRP